MKTVKLCKDCNWSRLEKDSTWDLRCLHPNVNAKDSWVLGAGDALGSSCRAEREHVFFTPCGRAGKLWEGKA